MAMHLPHGFPPPVDGLLFRAYLGEQDLPEMLDIFRSSRFGGHDFDHDDIVLESLEDITNKFRHLNNCDPFQDIRIAEVGGRMIAYGRVTWWPVQASLGAQEKRIYFMSWYIRPEWCGQGLDRTFLYLSQQRLRQVIRQQDSQAPFGGARLFESNATDLQPELAHLLEADGFQAVQWGSTMTCSNLQMALDVPLPVGLEVRPVRPDNYRQVWDAMWEAFNADADYVHPTENDFVHWQQSSQFQPDLWQVAWDHDFTSGAGVVAGMVLNYITRDITGTGPGTAWTEDICVRRPWRRRGLARALLARSVRMFREMGFSQTSLGVDLNNPHGARQLYESMGYQLVSVLTVYQRPVDP
jgi:ribosomal protein S18 acetylase RimI-like enzyme